MHPGKQSSIPIKGMGWRKCVTRGREVQGKDCRKEKGEGRLSFRWYHLNADMEVFISS